MRERRSAGRAQVRRVLMEPAASLLTPCRPHAQCVCPAGTHQARAVALAHAPARRHPPAGSLEQRHRLLPIIGQQRAEVHIAVGQAAGEHLVGGLLKAGKLVADDGLCRRE